MADSPSNPDPAPIRNVAFISLGCPKNLVDSEAMLASMTDAGFVLVSDHDDADAVVINTCGFLEAAKDESLHAIREAIERKRAGRVQRVVVAGCLVQRHRARLFDWAPGIDAMIGVFDRDHVIDAVRGPQHASHRDSAPGSTADTPPCWIAANALQAAKTRGLPTTGLTVHGTDGRGVGYFEDDARRFRLTPRHWTYLRLSEGCNQKCAFCTIPSIRGRMRSKPLHAVLAEARALLADGAFELNLIGQDTTSYGCDIAAKDATNPGLVNLLTSLNAAADDAGGAWLRLMYAYPTNFTDEMIDAIASLPNLVNYIDIPLQHVSDRMLQRMRRQTTRAQQEALLQKLRERIPGLAIRTTFITGFPGETEDDHRHLLEFIQDFQFDMLGVFQYSREHGTPAGTMDLDPDLHVPDEVKTQREQELMLAQQEIAFENAQYLAEQRCQFDVLIDALLDPFPLGEGGRRRQPGEGEPVEPSASRADAPTDRSLPLPLPPAEAERRLYLGRCYHQAPEVDSVTVVRSDAPLSPGEFVRSTIVDAQGYDLVARPTDELHRKTALPVVS